MNHQINSSQKSFHSTISNEQLHQIIEAITDGRYSWACVLILRFVGYNPLHFIPQRTYSRLIKENKQNNTITVPISNHQPHSVQVIDDSPTMNKANSLEYLETSETKQITRQGRTATGCLEGKIKELYQLQN